MAEPSVALSSGGEQLFIASGSELSAFALAPSERLGHGARPQPIPTPCAAISDIETINRKLVVLCGDGHVFERAKDRWRPLLVDDDHHGVALQRSDDLLLAVLDDGELVRVRDPEFPVGHLDRVRGPDRGGPSQPPVATFVHESSDRDAQVGVGYALRRSVVLTASSELGSVTCRTPGRYRIADIAITDSLMLAAVLVDRDERSWIVHVDADVPPWRQPRAGLHDPTSGRRTAKIIRCTKR
ncbi:MAG: hypothetical protein R6X02_29510 [Enhygromyxa sp.]